MLLQSLNEIKNKVSPFKIGEKVMCYWGSSGYDQEGTVVDPLVNYNNCAELTTDNSEAACVVRLKNKVLPTGFEVGQNEVIPHRQIKKAE